MSKIEFKSPKRNRDPFVPCDYRAWIYRDSRIIKVGGIDFDNNEFWESGKDIRYSFENHKDGFLMPYTGIKDDAGQKIFHGDILYCGDYYTNTENKVYSVVFWNPELLCWDIDESDQALWDKEDLKVVSNTCESPFFTSGVEYRKEHLLGSNKLNHDK